MRLEDVVECRELDALRRAGGLAAGLGGRLFVVGGSVRDIYLGQVHYDWDVVVEGATAADLARALAAEWDGQRVLHGRFMTAIVWTPSGMVCDVATSRYERYAHPGALPEVEVAAIEEDLWRRDFSVNAVAIELTPGAWGTVIDPTGGLEDIEAGVIRALHPRSFWDDATRAVRAVGFEQRLGFRLESQTEGWLREAVAGGALETVSRERLMEALGRVLRSSAGARALLRAEELGMWPGLGLGEGATAGVRAALGEVEAGLGELGEAEASGQRATACLAALLVGGQSAGKLARGLRLTRGLGRNLAAAEGMLPRWPTGFVAAERDGDLWGQLRGTCFAEVIALWLRSAETGGRAGLAHYWRHLRRARQDFAVTELGGADELHGPVVGEAIAAAIMGKLNDHLSADEQRALARRHLETHDRAPE